MCRPCFTSFGYINVFAEGIASLKVTYQDGFSVSPILTYESIAQSWRNYNTLSVSMLGQKDVEVSLVITSGGIEYIIPMISGEKTIELMGSDTEFQRFTFDLSKVDNSVLDLLTNVTFKVTGEGAGEMYFDNFSFGLPELN